MRNKNLIPRLYVIKSILYSGLSLVILLFSFTYALAWNQLPLKTQAQKNTGHIGGEGLQMIQSIAYAPSNPNVVYLVSDTSQVWKSRDGGQKWQIKHKGFYANGGLSIGVDPLNENIVFVAGSIGSPADRNTATNPLCGIFRTTDGGESWKLVKETPYFKRGDGDNGGTYFVFSNPDTGRRRNKNKTIYAATYNDGLLKSIDGGDTWVSCALKGYNIYDLKANPKNFSLIYIATSQGLFKYDTNTGEASQIGAGLPEFPRTIAVNPINPNIIFAAVANYGVYKSIDGGIKFTDSSQGLPLGLDYTHISLSPANPDYIYVAVNKNALLNPFYSHNGGNNWYSPNTLDKNKLSLTGEQRFFSGQITPHPTNPYVALAAANGKARVIKTTDGGMNWFYSNDGYTGGRMGIGKTSLGFSEDPKKMVLFLIDHGPALTNDGGVTFSLLPVMDAFGLNSTPVGAYNGNVIVSAVGSWGKQLLEISEDNGKSWRTIGATEDSYKFIAFHPQNQNIIYAQGFKSMDRGKTWKTLSKKIYAVYGGNGDIVYAIEPSGLGQTIIRRSDDGGQTWPISYPAIPVSSTPGIDIDPANPDRLYVATNVGVYIYDNKINNWIKKDSANGLSKDYFGLEMIKCVAVDPRHPEIIYAGRYAPDRGQSNGIFRSQDYGMTWQSITFNLDDPITIWSIAVSPHDSTVYIGSSHGTWKSAPPY